MREIWKKENKSVFIAAAVLVLFILLDLGRKWITVIDETTYYYIASLLSAAILFLAARLTARTYGKKAKEFFRLRIFRLRWIPITACAAVCACLGAALINLGLRNIGLPDWLMPQAGSIFSGEDSDPLAAVLMLGILPAVFEELFIHGACLSAYENGGVFRSVCVSALIFSLLHGSLPDLFGTFFAALIFGYLTVATGSVFPAMAAHLLNNLLSGSVMFYGQNFFNIGYDGFFLLVAAVGFLVFLFLFLWFLDKLLQPRTPMPDRTQKAQFLPGGSLILLGVWVVKVVLSCVGVL